MRKENRYRAVLEHFQKLMPEVTTELEFGSVFQLLVAVILSAQCTDKRINQVTPELFSRFPDARHMAEAEADEIYDHPLHPYSKSLISAVPIPDPKTARANKRIPLQGDIPSPLHAPSGCPFRTRCPYAQERCGESMPSFEEVSSGHFVACHRTAEING